MRKESSWQQRVAHLTREQSGQTRTCPTTVVKTGSYLTPSSSVTPFAKVAFPAAVAELLMQTRLTFMQRKGPVWLLYISKS